MNISGTRRRYIGNLPKKRKMSANRNSSTWQPSARRLPIALRIVWQAGSLRDPFGKERRPTKVAAIALANKIARMAWAMVAKGDRYRQPVALAA